MTRGIINFELGGHATQMLWKTTNSIAVSLSAPTDMDALQYGPQGLYEKALDVKMLEAGLSIRSATVHLQVWSHLELWRFNHQPNGG